MGFVVTANQLQSFLLLVKNARLEGLAQLADFLEGIVLLTGDFDVVQELKNRDFIVFCQVPQDQLNFVLCKPNVFELLSEIFGQNVSLLGDVLLEGGEDSPERSFVFFEQKHHFSQIFV